MVAENTERIAVVGMGNLLMSDDGVGVHALRILEKNGLDDVELIDAGTAIIHTADCLRDVDRILVMDAFKGGGSPGTVYVMEGDSVFENDYSLSVHSLGLKTALNFLTPSHAPREWTLIGIEPACLEHGMELSPQIEAVLPEVVRTAEKIINGWKS